MLVNELSFMPQLPNAKHPNFSQCNTSRGCRRLFSNSILLVLQLKETSNGLNLMSWQMSLWNYVWSTIGQIIWLFCVEKQQSITRVLSPPEVVTTGTTRYIKRISILHLNLLIKFLMKIFILCANQLMGFNEA